MTTITPHTTRADGTRAIAAIAAAAVVALIDECKLMPHCSEDAYSIVRRAIDAAVAEALAKEREAKQTDGL
mgnify:CR=1 FL=1